VGGPIDGPRSTPRAAYAAEFRRAPWHARAGWDEGSKLVSAESSTPIHVGPVLAGRAAARHADELRLLLEGQFPAATAEAGNGCFERAI
jgi:hypothetical protein